MWISSPFLLFYFSLPFFLVGGWLSWIFASQVAVDLKVMYKNVAYLLTNKEAMDTNLLILQEQKKESELMAELKSQLDKKLKSLKEKNRNILDLQWKYNE